jgi:hypothetical protein
MRVGGLIFAASVACSVAGCVSRSTSVAMCYEVPLELRPSVIGAVRAVALQYGFVETKGAAPNALVSFFQQDPTARGVCDEPSGDYCVNISLLHHSAPEIVQLVATERGVSSLPANARSLMDELNKVTIKAAGNSSNVPCNGAS